MGAWRIVGTWSDEPCRYFRLGALVDDVAELRLRLVEYGGYCDGYEGCDSPGVGYALGGGRPYGSVGAG